MMADDPICPCDGRPDERTISNPPGRDSIAYRVGDFTTFRHALLKARPKEQSLTPWRPGADGDLGVQMLEWWAYIADILTFYSERAANESYLRTATLAQSVNRLIRTIGYRPRPGIAAHGAIVALAGGHKTIVLPKGLSFDSKPGPGESPQTFELDADTAITPLGTVAADVPAFLFSPAANTFLVLGTTVPFAVKDILLLSDRNAVFAPIPLTVTAIKLETGADGKKRNRVTFTSAAPPAGLAADDVLIQYASQSMPVWSQQYGIYVLPLPAWVDLSGIARDIHAGDYVLITAPGRSELQPVSKIVDVVWYSNHPGTNPSVPPPAPEVPLAVLHTRLIIATMDPAWDAFFASAVVRYGWRSVGQLLNQPVATYDGTPATLAPVAPALFPTGPAQTVVIADALGEGVSGLGSVGDAGATLSLGNLPRPPPVLTLPLTAHFNILPISRGKTVAAEVLGSGDATVAGQEFVLKKSPLTYLANGDGNTSTLALRVNGRLWSEVPSFYGQPPGAEIFVTVEDDGQKTHVQFGDGVNGARLPTGANNVTATYRYGSGLKSPASGEITVIDKPWPNLKSVKNPVPVGGGADPDPPDQIRRFAPPSVLTFGRAISADDYEAIAGRAPGVTRVQSVWSFDGVAQRAVVKIYVGDDQAAYDSAQAAIAASADPHRHVVFALATPIPISLDLKVLVDARADPDAAAAAVRAALQDADTGLFGPRRMGIGRAVFDSEIAAACLACDGVLSLRGATFLILASANAPDPGPRHDPGEGGFYVLAALSVVAEVDQNAG